MFWFIIHSMFYEYLIFRMSFPLNKDFPQPNYVKFIIIIFEPKAAQKIGKLFIISFFLFSLLKYILLSWNILHLGLPLHDCIIQNYTKLYVLIILCGCHCSRHFPYSLWWSSRVPIYFHREQKAQKAPQRHLSGTIPIQVVFSNTWKLHDYYILFWTWNCLACMAL